MIKTILKVVSINIVMLALLLPGFVQAQDLKIGFVNVQQVLLKSPQVKAAFDEMRKEFEGKQKDMLTLQSEIQAMREKATRDELTMKDSERKSLEQKMILKDRDLRTKQAFYDEDLKIRRNDVQNQFRDDIYKSIIVIAQADKYDLILTEGVVFSSDRTNLSDRVLEELKKGKK